MERKTKINAIDGKQELTITREFDLPVELLFKAFTDADVVSQWMGTQVLKLENKKHGGYQFETTDASSKLTMHVIYRSVAGRDQLLQLPFALGINMAHNRLQAVMRPVK